MSKIYLTSICQTLCPLTIINQLSIKIIPTLKPLTKSKILTLNQKENHNQTLTCCTNNTHKSSLQLAKERGLHRLEYRVELTRLFAQVQYMIKPDYQLTYVHKKKSRKKKSYFSILIPIYNSIVAAHTSFSNRSPM